VPSRPVFGLLLYSRVHCTVSQDIPDTTPPETTPDLSLTIPHALSVLDLLLQALHHPLLVRTWGQCLVRVQVRKKPSELVWVVRDDSVHTERDEVFVKVFAAAH
jgi:hypothetical protein